MAGNDQVSVDIVNMIRLALCDIADPAFSDGVSEWV